MNSSLLLTKKICTQFHRIFVFTGNFHQWKFSQPASPVLTSLTSVSGLFWRIFTSHTKCIFSPNLICLNQCFFQSSLVCFHTYRFHYFIILNHTCCTMTGWINVSACTDHLKAHLSSFKHPTALCCPAKGDVYHTKETVLSKRCSAAIPWQLAHVPLEHCGWDYPKTTLEGLSRQGILSSDFGVSSNSALWLLLQV